MSVPVSLLQVSVVGVVRSSAPTETNVQYSLDDMTGPPLVVKQWVGTEVGNPGNHALYRDALITR